MTRLIVAADADADFDDILAYLQEEAGLVVADDYDKRLCETIERLVDLPESGAPRPLLGLSIRIAVVSPYVVIYDYSRDDDTLTLLRILHGRRDITEDLLHR
ncbi:MAG: toxin ParE1/3/4 [Alphaproteobacteria bacterium]|nr:toxin ParE1/3/4 [Alphaproteobacteria bacterium]